MANTNEALGEQMQEEAAQELIQGYGHQFLLVVDNVHFVPAGRICNDFKNSMTES